jgi:hypothetical protein
MDHHGRYNLNISVEYSRLYCIPCLEVSLYKVKGKGKVYPCIGTEALYRPYSP